MKKKKTPRFKLKTPKRRLDLWIPDDLKSALKDYCHKTGQGLTDAVLRAIRELIHYKENF
jgi:hypothetical protein